MTANTSTQRRSTLPGLAALNPLHARSRRGTPPLKNRSWLLAGVGLAVFHLSVLLGGSEDGLWLPAVGIGLALLAWLGWWIVPVVAADFLLFRLLLGGDVAVARLMIDSFLLGTELLLSWWLYACWVRGARRLGDPQSAVLFLILVPGIVAALFAALQAALWTFWGATNFWALAGGLWISRALGFLVLAPVLLVVVTPFLVRRRLTEAEKADILSGRGLADDWTLGEIIETSGLVMGAGILSIVLAILHLGHVMPGLSLWGFSLLLVVWASLRQGLRGGALAALAGSVPALLVAEISGMSPAEFSPLQGNLLAQCSTAILVGASAAWIRTSEARYRQLMGHIPAVLYSARLPRGLAAAGDSVPQRGAGGSKLEVHVGTLITDRAEVTQVSSASRHIFGCEPEDLVGPFRDWFERIVPEDRELVTAALAQLCLQLQPVVCEYRVAKPATANDGISEPAPMPPIRWLRDTMAPFHSNGPALDGWEGVIEDITEQRELARDLRHAGNMLQTVVANLPTGVFLVQGPIGQPLLVNQRARQLLGQRADLASGLDHISAVYHLHKTDGSAYPVAELPVTRALREGLTCMANDLVVHRMDGRRLPLVTWAAPVDVAGLGKPDCAVWILEDMTALQHAESAWREAEARLRAVFDTMAEGVVVQNQAGEVIQCNPAACAILGLTQQQLLGRTSLGPEHGCIRADGTPFPSAEQPDRLVLSSKKPAHDVIMGLPLPDAAQPMRWILVNALPMPGSKDFGQKTQGAHVVATFTDITSQRKTLGMLQVAQRLELVGRLASGTVHDVNNLLAVMMGLAGLAQRNLPAEHPARNDLARIVEAGEQASHLAGQLLAFGKTPKPKLRKVNVGEIIEHSLRLLRGSLPSTIDVECHLPAHTLLVHADEVQLKQVLMNLCLNARDAMADGGTLTVRAEREETAAAVDEHGDIFAWVKLSIQDTGQGIAEADLERIFEPFFSTKERGTGLGLAVVRQIIEGYGGRIVVHSKLNEGTCMAVWLRAG